MQKTSWRWFWENCFRLVGGTLTGNGGSTLKMHCQNCLAADQVSGFAGCVNREIFEILELVAGILGNNAASAFIEHNQPLLSRIENIQIS